MRVFFQTNHVSHFSVVLSALIRSCVLGVRLSGRGGLLLKLLLEAEALFHTETNLCTGHTLQEGDHQLDEDPKDRALLIFSYLLWEITAEALGDCGAGAELGGDVKATVRLLQGSPRVQAELLQELEECLTEGGTESLLQSIRVLAQVLRDLYPLQAGLRLSPPADGAVYSRSEEHTSELQSR